MRRFAALAFFVAAWLLTADRTRPAEEAKKPAGASYQVPYRVTDTRHVLVRARINGKGPFHFIVDTGAPSMFIGTAASRKLGVEADRNGWGTFDRFEIEGGLVMDKVRGRIDDVFQVESMNKTGMAGVELHGILGYNVLAHYRLTFDFTKPKMTWQRIDFDPMVQETLAGKGPVDGIGGLMKGLAELKLERSTTMRGFLGVELTEKAGAVLVTDVLADSPAAEAGLKTGDRISEISAKPIKSIAEAHRLVAAWGAGDEVEMTVVRDGKARSVRATLGGGL